MEFKAEGNKLFGKGKIQEALKAYSTGIDKIEAAGEDTNTNLSEEDRGCLPVLYSNRSMLHLGCCQVDEALQDAECSIGNNPDFAKAYLRRAAVLMDLFDFKSALEDLDKAEELEPGAAPEGCEGRLRCSGKKWVHNCYLKKQMELRKKHHCNYVLHGEFEGEPFEEPVHIPRGTTDHKEFREAWDGAVAEGKETKDLFLSISLNVSPDGTFYKMIEKSVPPSSTDKDGKENNVDRVALDTNKVIENLLNEQFRREFSPDIDHRLIGRYNPASTEISSVDYFVHQALESLGVPGGEIFSEMFGQELDHNIPILLPSAPKWCLPEMLDAFTTAVSLCLQIDGGPRKVAEFEEEERPVIEEAARKHRVYRRRFEGRESKCYGCGDKINDPDPQECLCGEMFCSFPCHKRKWPTHKATCRKAIVRGKLVENGGILYTTLYWLCAVQGFLPYKKEPDFMARWKERGITAENHDDPLKVEEDFHYDNEYATLKSEMSLVQKATNDDQRDFIMCEMLGKWSRKMTTPLPGDSVPRLRAKIRVCGYLVGVAQELGDGVPFPNFEFWARFVRFVRNFKATEPGAKEFIAKFGK